MAKGESWRTKWRRLFDIRQEEDNPPAQSPDETTGKHIEGPPETRHIPGPDETKSRRSRRNRTDRGE